MSQLSQNPQGGHNCHNDNNCHTLSQLVTTLSPRCHNLADDVNLERVFTYLQSGGCPKHITHYIIDVLVEKLKIQAHEDFNKRNLQYEINEFVKMISGSFSVNDAYQAIAITTKQEKATVRQILHRMAEKNIIKRDGAKGGIYRPVDNSLEEIDWQNATDGEFPITLPLGIHNYAKIQPKNLIVVAGSANSGKTAFLLNIVKDNMCKYDINYFSSEMSETEFKERITNFGDPPPDKWKFKAYNRCSNFQDVIKPNDINIIDFLELHDEFWKVGKIMLEIYEKLDKGIAVIALQKMKGAKTGRGGDFTLEKPRLYISMENGSLCIEKAKNWRDNVNPNNLQIPFKLVQGAKMMNTAPWDYRR